MTYKLFCFVFFIAFCNKVESASLLERSYEYVVNLGKSLAPNFMSILDCFGEDDMWTCAKLKAGKLLDNWDNEVNKQRTKWQVEADTEVTELGRSIQERPSEIGSDVEKSINIFGELFQHAIARAFSRTKRDGGAGSKTSSTSDKLEIQQKLPNIRLVQPIAMQKRERGLPFGGIQSWVIGQEFRQLDPKNVENASVGKDLGDVSTSSNEIRNIPLISSRRGRGLFSELWTMGEKALDAIAEHAVGKDSEEDGVVDKSSITEQRGKKKKKKKAILKLLLLGAVLKAKIGTLLQILSFKLQVKFFLIALIGLGINLARFWLDLKKQHQPPQKVIYYEHAQHQHHYDHEEEPWGGWSRSIFPSDDGEEVEADSSPYRAYDRSAPGYLRPVIKRV